jgi:hypothetical protein
VVDVTCVRRYNYGGDRSELLVKRRGARSLTSCSPEVTIGKRMLHSDLAVTARVDLRDPIDMQQDKASLKARADRVGKVNPL